MRQRIGMLFPIRAIKLLDLNGLKPVGLQAPHVDAESIGIGARHVKRLDPANAAKQVLRNAGIEPVIGQLILPLDEVESRSRDDQMQETGFGADRTIASLGQDPNRGIDLKSNGATVATPAMAFECGHVRISKCSLTI
jgi:hypothetical protein